MVSHLRENRARITKIARAKMLLCVARKLFSPHGGKMKTLELSDETYAALQRLAAARNLTPSDLLSTLLGTKHQPDSDQLLFFITGAEFARLTDSIDRYLALLAWVAENYSCDFADFISHQDSARHYLMLDREKISDIRSRNLARQIDGTQFWAVMTIDDATRCRFVCRLLEFIGCHDETVTQAVQSLGFPSTSGFVGRAI
jgi:SeqA protein C-terminal domain